MNSEQDQHLSRRARMVALVIAATMLVWLGVQWLGGRIGLNPEYAFLFDLAALAAFFWSFVVAIQIWRNRRED